MLTLSVGDAPAELRAAVLAMKRADAEVRRGVSARMRETMNPEWRSEVTQHLTGSGPLEGRMLTAGVRITGGNPPQLVAASSRKRVGRGDLTPAENWQLYEFGSHGTKRSKMTSRKGRAYTRRTTTGLPAFRKTGRVLYPAAARILPRVAAFWAQSVIRAFLDALDGKAR
jgi:hypothetical protein